MKILFIYDNYSPYGGGSQIVSLTLFKKLNEYNFQTYYLTNDFVPSELANKYRERIVNNSLNLKVDNKFLDKFHLPLILDPKNIKFIFKNKFDIIQCFEPSFLNLEILSFKKMTGTKIVFYVSTTFASNFEATFLERGIFDFINLMQKFLVSSSDALIFPSKYMKKFFNIRSKPWTIIYPPIKNHFLYHEIKPKKEKPTDLVVVSRLSPEKNLHLLVKAMAFLKGKFKLHIIGEGFERKRLEKLVRKFNLKNEVIFHGWVPNSQLPEILDNFDLFVFPSNHETFGMAPIEALAVGLPLIVFDYPLNREIIPAGTAIFVNSLQPKIWAKTILNLQQNPKLYSQLVNQVKNKKHLLLKYSEDTAVKKLINFYQNILK